MKSDEEKYSISHEGGDERRVNNLRTDPQL